MPTKDNKVKNIRMLITRLYYCHIPNRETEKAFINAVIASNANSKFNDQPETMNWCFTDELNSLEIKRGKRNAHNNTKDAISRQWLEDLIDDIKQTFVRNYKISYGE
jgi:hypothetical protein